MSKIDLNVEGTVVSVGELFEKGDFKKKDLIVETGGDYPQRLSLEFVKDKEELLDLVSAGQKVKVFCNVRGREWIDPKGVAKYFASFSAWKIEVIA
jgi:hypothetical protein